MKFSEFTLLSNCKISVNPAVVIAVAAGVTDTNATVTRIWLVGAGEFAVQESYDNVKYELEKFDEGLAIPKS